MRDLPDRIHVQWDQWDGNHLIAMTDPGELHKAQYAEYIRADLVNNQRVIVLTEKDTRARELLEEFYQWVVRKQWNGVVVPAEHENDRHAITIHLYKQIYELLQED